jgi:hypothetical protein
VSIVFCVALIRLRCCSIWDMCRIALRLPRVAIGALPLLLICPSRVLAFQFDVSHVAIDIARTDLRLEMSFADLQLMRPAFWLFYSGQNPVPSNQRFDSWLSNGGAEILRIERDWLKTSKLAYLDSSYYGVNSARARSPPQTSVEVDKVVAVAIPNLSSDSTASTRWRELLKPEQLHTLQSMRDYIMDVHKELGRDARQPGRAEFESALKLLQAPSLPIREKDLVGQRRFHSMDVTTVGVFSYPVHECRFAMKDDTLSFERPGGYAVVARSGNLYRNDDNSFVFVGTRIGYDVEGRVTRRMDSVGVLLRKSKERYLMILDPTPTMYEIYEIRK